VRLREDFKKINCKLIVILSEKGVDGVMKFRIYDKSEIRGGGAKEMSFFKLFFATTSIVKWGVEPFWTMPMFFLEVFL